jgi:hypothetical protein
VRQASGVGFKPQGWAALRNAEIAHVMQHELGIKSQGTLTYGRSEGVVIGAVTTSLGRHAIIDRGTGHAAMPLQAGQDAAIGHVIGRGLGVER